MQPMRPRFATLSMRTATAGSKCVLTGPGSSTVLAAASCDARFALAKMPKTKGRTPLATVQRSLLAVHALFRMNARLKDQIRMCRVLHSHAIVASSVHLAVDWSSESSRCVRSHTNYSL